MGERVLAVEFVFLSVLTVCATLCVLRALRLKYRNAAPKDDFDTRTMQEINRGLQRMENRIDSLETLLMDQPRRRSARRGMD